MNDLADIADAVRRQGFAFVPRSRMLQILPRAALDVWDEFAGSWEDLGPDGYMADGGRYRRRRHAAFGLGPAGAERKPHQPHYQSRDYNRLNGGLQRWFEPVTEAAATSAVTAAVLRTCQALFSMAEGAEATAERHVELHQFRIEPAAEGEGRPTPEGVHRDGVDWVCVLLVARTNVERGVTTIHDLAGTQLGAFTLTDPLDAVFLDDSRVFHGVTPIQRIDQGARGFRDVLVVTLA